MLSNADFLDLAREIHAGNVAAGWWSDLHSQESILTTRNRPEMLMLAVSEIAEGYGGIGQNDDKLHHLPMFDVEIGDFVIRQFDTIGAEISLGAEPPDFERIRRATEWLKYNSAASNLMELVMFPATAMEHYRKGRMQEYVQSMADGVGFAFALAEAMGIDLLDVVAQKRAFNATREDHKRDSRLGPDGKAF